MIEARKIYQPWPEKELEYLGCCPICGSNQRSILYNGLRDRVFYCAPGEWTLHSCGQCACAYLDPRPSQNSMGRAYEHYFTHHEEEHPANETLLQKAKRAAKNGYQNRAWGTSRFPASKILGFLLPPSRKAVIDEEWMRHLPRPANGRKLLDVGCGSGLFLSFANQAGWRVTGVDLDPKAVEAARARGIDVRLGGVEVLAGEESIFDAITLSHVIEHVYEPRELLTACYRLLKPGGYFWVETPNIRSHGHRVFREAWIGLDPPRHLLIMTWSILRDMLKAAGFKNIVVANWRPEYNGCCCASKAIKEGKDPMKAKGSVLYRLRNCLAENKNKWDLKTREYIAFTATKPT